MGKRIKPGKVFVQIASYRDPELKPTIKNMLENSHFPQNLVICIAHQYSEEDEWDNLDEYKKDKRFKIISIPYKDAKGACDARNQIQQKYNGEEYTLQLDSHHRFVEGWDTKVISMYEDLRSKGHNKPLLTSYISSYDPKNDPEKRADKPWAMKFDRFTPEGVIFFLPYWLDEKRLSPIPARFFSAHFAFTTGRFCEEVPHDPQLYFHGEEISLAVRAFTNGYDLFHPNEIIAYHEYTRAGRTKHWDDHVDWNDDNLASHARMRKLLGVDGECAPCQRAKEFPKYGLGTERTLEEYEEYSGVRFKDRALRGSAINNEVPTLGIKDEEWNLKFKHCIDVHVDNFKEDDYTFAAVILLDKDGKEVYRKDDMHFNDKTKGKDFMNLWIEANIEKPDKWIVWAHSEKKSWAEKITGKL
tara:strand:+ start:371 stop:1612 length:1242 start_codon:yes stop_codon:yes gene_type:complete